MPAKKFSKFTQDNKEAWSYVLYENGLAIALSRNESFTIVAVVCLMYFVQLYLQSVLTSPTS